MMDYCCFPCFKKSEKHEPDTNNVPVAHPAFPPLATGHTPSSTLTEVNNNHVHDANTIDSSHIEAKSFTFRELAMATKHFRQECLLSESGSGRVFKGTLQPDGKIVSVKQLDKNSTHGTKEFLLEVLMLSLLHHSNLLELVGYCADGDQRLLVYEYMPMGSVERHLLDLDVEKKPLDWINRMKIACGIAQGLEYLHEKANPPIIYRDLKCSNIMLDDDFNPKLSDYGLAKLGGNNKSHVTVMGSYGYSAPEYERHGELTLKSDVYNFGVILLELITGRRAVDTSRQADEQNLVTWAQPIFRDPRRFPEMADPRLTNSFPVKSLNQAVGVAAMCLQDEPDVRPLISDVVVALSTLSISLPDEPVEEHPQEMRAPSRKESHRHKTDQMRAPSRKQSHRDTTDQSAKIGSESSWSDYEETDDKSHAEQNDQFMDEKSESDYESGSSGMNSDVEEKYQEEEKEDYSEMSSDVEEEEEYQEEEEQEQDEEEDEEQEKYQEHEEDREQEREDSIKYNSNWGFMDSLEYEVASMSSGSSYSGDESQLESKPQVESINKKSIKNVQFQHPNIGSSSTRKSSLKMKCKSSKRPQVESAHLRRSSTSSAQSSRNKNAHLSYKRRSSIIFENENIGSSHSKQSSNAESDNGKKSGIASYSRRKSSKAESDNGMNQRIASYSRRKSSKEDSDNGKNQSIASYSRRKSSKEESGNGKNQSIASYSRRKSSKEESDNGKNQSIDSYSSPESSKVESDNGKNQSIASYSRLESSKVESDNGKNQSIASYSRLESSNAESDNEKNPNVASYSRRECNNANSGNGMNQSVISYSRRESSKVESNNGKNQSIASYSRQKSSDSESSNGETESIASYSRKSSNAYSRPESSDSESDNGKTQSIASYSVRESSNAYSRPESALSKSGKQKSIGSSSSNSSIEEFEYGGSVESSSHHSDNEDREEESLL